MHDKLQLKLADWLAEHQVKLSKSSGTGYHLHSSGSSYEAQRQQMAKISARGLAARLAKNRAQKAAAVL